MRRLNERGNVLLFSLIAMSLMAFLGTSIYFLTSTSAVGSVSASDELRADQIARTGIDYALMKNLGETAGRVFTLSNGDKFSLVISGNTVESTGIVKEGTPYEVRKKISVTQAGFGSRPDVSFAKDIQSFTSPSQSASGFITTDTSAAEVSLGKIGMGSTFGALWYGGSATQGDCQNGLCTFGTGFRAFFVFQFGVGSTGDGFTFAFFSGNPSTNDIHSVGGASGMGELMGYAGDSRIDIAGTSFLDGKGGRGIQPPKIAIEFDPYPNTGISTFCSSGIPVSDQRADGSKNHMAYVFWGDENSCGYTLGRNTFDDNRHGTPVVETASNPQNARSANNPGGIDTSSYFRADAWPSNWLLSNAPTNVYALRVEVARGTTPTGGNYSYTIKSWIKQCSTNDINCPTYDDNNSFSNTKINYNDIVPGDTATLNRTVALNEALHSKFNTFFFGWTTATGGATQNILMKRFRINFMN